MAQDQREILRAESAKSLLSISPHHDALLTVSRNVVALSDLSAAKRLAQSSAFRDLAFKLCTEMAIPRKRPRDRLDDEALVILARGVVRPLGADPLPHGVTILAGVTEALMRQRSGFWPEAKILITTIIHLCLPAYAVLGPGEMEAFGWTASIRERMFNHFMSDLYSGDANITPSTTHAYLHSLIIATQTVGPLGLHLVDAVENICNITKILGTDSTPHSDVHPETELLLCLVCRVLSCTLKCLSQEGAGFRLPTTPRYVVSILKEEWDSRPQ